MLIGEDHISNGVITLGTCFSMFVYIRARFLFALIGGNLTTQSSGSHREIGGGIGIQRARPVLKLNENPVNVQRIKISTAIACFDSPAFLFRLQQPPRFPGFGFKPVRLYAVLSICII